MLSSYSAHKRERASEQVLLGSQSDQLRKFEWRYRWWLRDIGELLL